MDVLRLGLGYDNTGNHAIDAFSLQQQGQLSLPLPSLMLQISPILWPHNAGYTLRQPGSNGISNREITESQNFKKANASLLRVPRRKSRARAPRWCRVWYSQIDMRREHKTACLPGKKVRCPAELL